MVDREQMFLSIMGKMGHKDPNIYKRFQNFTTEMGKFLIQQSQICFPEERLPVLMAALALADLNSSMQGAIIDVFGGRMVDKLKSTLKNLTPEKLREILGKDVSDQEAKDILAMAKSASEGSDDFETQKMAEMMKGQPVQ